MLVQIPDLLDRETLARFRAALARADWQDGRSTAGAQAGKVKHNLQLTEEHRWRANWAR